MCLNPIVLPTNSRSIGRDSLQGYMLTVPCGKCAECLSLARNQYYLRNYWQCRECVDSDGFVLFDTLTYDSEHLPHLSDYFPQLRGGYNRKRFDFSCFSHEDTANFMKRLRKSLSDNGYDVDGNLKYFLVSEYGHEEEYKTERGIIRKGTLRPHCHVLFYCNVPLLTPEHLAYIINKSWGLGFTDNVRKGKVCRTALDRNTFRKSADDVQLRRVASYVAKYVTKDGDYEKVVDKRLCLLMNHLTQDAKWKCWRKCRDGHFEWYVASSFKPLYKRLRRQVETFHRQSQGFGLYALDSRNFGEEEERILFEQGAIKMQDEDKGWKFIPVPEYYVRKLYYTLVSDVERVPVGLDGNFKEVVRHSWVPTERGKDFIAARSVLSFSNTVKRLTDWYLNLPEYSEERLKAGTLLDHRTFEDLATYQLFYKGRVLPSDGIVTPDSVICARQEWNPYEPHEYSNAKDGIHFKKVIPDSVFVAEDSVPCDFTDWLLETPYEEEYIVPHNDFARRNVINDSFSHDFRHFDELLNYYNRTNSGENKKKQRTFNVKEHLRKTFRKC